VDDVPPRAVPGRAARPAEGDVHEHLAEYHRGDASLVHTDPDGARDLEHGPSVRVYHFAARSTGPACAADGHAAAPADPHGWVDRSQNLRGVVNYGRLLRACLINLDRWVTDGIAPPPSCHPRVADGTAMAPETLAKTFDAIPGARYPRRHARPLRQTTAPTPRCGGSRWRRRSRRALRHARVGRGQRRQRGRRHRPARAGRPARTHTGWNLRHADIGGVEQLLVFAGATLPFAKTRRERATSGDPRPAIASAMGRATTIQARPRGRARPRGGRLPAGGGRRDVAGARGADVGRLRMSKPRRSRCTGQRHHRRGGPDRDAVSPADGAAAEVHTRRGGRIVRDPALPLRPEGPLPALAAHSRRRRRRRLGRALRRTPKLRRLLLR